MRALLAGLTMLVVLAVGTDLGQLARVAGAPDAPCCCGPAGDEHGCACTGPCCDHGPRRAHDRSVAGFDDHCGARPAVPQAATGLLPGTPVATRAPRPAVTVARLAPAEAPAHGRSFAAPPEPPPRTRAA